MSAMKIRKGKTGGSGVHPASVCGNESRGGFDPPAPKVPQHEHIDVTRNHNGYKGAKHRGGKSY